MGTHRDTYFDAFVDDALEDLKNDNVCYAYTQDQIFEITNVVGKVIVKEKDGYYEIKKEKDEEYN